MKVTIGIGRKNIGNGWTGARWRFNVTVSGLEQARQMARALSMVIRQPVTDLEAIGTDRGHAILTRRV